MADTAPSKVETLLAGARAEYERTQQELKDVRRMVDQSRGEVDKLAQRSAAIAAHVRQLQAGMGTMSPIEVKTVYETAQDAQQRLYTMRGQLEKLQSEQAGLERLVAHLEREQQHLADLEPEQPAGDTLPVIVRIVEAQEAERQRLSRQIHDGPAQALSNFILQTEIAMRLFDIDTERARAELQNLKTSATTSFQKVRDFIFDLRPMMLDDLGLAPTVKRYVDAFKEKSSLGVSLTVTGSDQRLESAREVVIFRAIQELLGNIRQHASATQVRLQLDLDANRARVVVEDNGKGFEPEAVLAAGHKMTGLAALKDRMDLLGGQLAIESQPGQGTRVTLIVPVGS